VNLKNPHFLQPYVVGLLAINPYPKVGTQTFFVPGVSVRKSQISKFAKKKAVFLLQIRIGLPLKLFFTCVRMF
jgi:hypothetical protein